MARRYKAPPVPSSGDLDVLHPDRLVLVRGAAWTVREYGLRESAQLAALGQRYAKAREAGERDEEAITHLLARATGRPVIEVAGLSESEFDALVAAWDEVNLHAFIEQPAKAGGGEPLRWADIYATLIEGGHALDDIGKYTARQLRLFYEAAIRLERNHRASHVGDLTFGFAGGKPAKDRIKELRKTTP